MGHAESNEFGKLVLGSACRGCDVPGAEFLALCTGKAYTAASNRRPLSEARHTDEAAHEKRTKTP
jgi:hypothetical protein